MIRHIAVVASFVAVLGVSADSPAAPVPLSAELSTAAENPPATPLLTSSGDPRPTSSGTATFSLNDARTALTFSATVQNIDFTGNQTPDDTNDNLTVAHIHAGPDVTPTTNGGVVWGFFGQPFNETSPNDQVVTPLASGVGGTISGKWDLPEGNNTTLDQQIDNLLNGRAYINFHTEQFPGGELRGNLQVIPLPPAALMGLLCLGAIGAKPAWAALRHRRRA